MKLKIVIPILIMILLLLGCSSKQTEYIYVEPKPYLFQIVEQPKVREVRVYKDDEVLYRTYIKNLRSIIEFQNNQIKDYFKSFETKETLKD